METIVLKTDSLRMTEDEFFNFCQENKQLRMERDRYQNIYIMSPTGNKTSIYNSEINLQLALWNRQVKLGYIFDSNVGFTLPNGAVRSPDAAFIYKERFDKLPEKDKERFGHICPDFVIELKSPSDSIKYLTDKMDEWMENGCRLAFLILPESQEVHVYKPGNPVIVKNISEKIPGENVLPGFGLDLGFMQSA